MMLMRSKQLCPDLEADKIPYDIGDNADDNDKRDEGNDGDFGDKKEDVMSLC